MERNGFMRTLHNLRYPDGNNDSESSEKSSEKFGDNSEMLRRMSLKVSPKMSLKKKSQVNM